MGWRLGFRDWWSNWALEGLREKWDEWQLRGEDWRYHGNAVDVISGKLFENDLQTYSRIKKLKLTFEKLKLHQLNHLFISSQGRNNLRWNCRRDFTSHYPLPDVYDLSQIDNSVSSLRMDADSLR
jgi:hypothetical protein